MREDTHGRELVIKGRTAACRSWRGRARDRRVSLRLSAKTSLDY
jgi:hypothetical protein